MKKSLLLGLTAAACFGCAWAEGADRPEPKKYENASFQRISANGRYAISEAYGTVIIFDLATGENVEFAGNGDDVNYTLGQGNCLTADGSIILGNYPTDADAVYYEGGEWHRLNVYKETFNNHANGITPDGKRICGNIGLAGISLDEESTMQVPVYWDRNEDGSYGEYNVLPRPTKDFFGDNPQYVTAIAILPDGKTILGQMVSGNGMMAVPVIYKQDENGEWSYNCPTRDLFNPNQIPVVEDPGESPAYPAAEQFLTGEGLDEYSKAMQEYENNKGLLAPSELDYMTPEEKAAYQAALEAYMDNWEENPYPQYSDYMTDEEKEAFDEALKEWQDLTRYPDPIDYMTAEEKETYEEAKKEYDIEYAKWSEKYQAFSDYRLEVLDSSPNFLFNNVFISTDNKYYVGTLSADVENDDPMSWMPFKTVYIPYTLDIETGELKKVDTEISCIVSGVADDGVILAAEPMRETNMMGYVFKDGNVQTIIDYIVSVVPEYKQWIDQNMSFEVLVDYDEDFEPILEEITFGGMPVSTPDMSIITTWVLLPDTFEIIGAIYDLNDYGAVAEIRVKDNITAGAGGTVIVPEGFAALDIYGLDGVCLKSVSEPEGVISLDLSAGVYVAKGTRTDGTVSIVKVAVN